MPLELKYWLLFTSIKELQTCIYGSEKKINYYDYGRKKYSQYQCTLDKVLGSEYCKFHWRDYAKMNIYDIINSFYSLLDATKKENAPLLCIGFNLVGEIIIFERRFDNDLYFNYATFGGPVSFLNSRFMNTSFSGAKFSWRADFTNTRFDGLTDFKKVLFKGETDFTNTRFDGLTDFSNATFINNVKFTDVKFTKETDFSNATFINNVKFVNMNFEDVARFANSVFRGSAHFIAGNFEGVADFTNTWFEESAYLDVVNFSKLADFTSTRDIYTEYSKQLTLKSLPNKADVLIIIKRNGQEYEMMLDSKGTSYEKMGGFKFEGDPEEKFRVLFKDIQDHTNDINEAVQRNGEYLYDILFTESLKDKYWKIRDEITSIQILSEEPWIPWEIVKPYRKLDNGEVESDTFICERFAMSRWITGRERQIKDRLEDVKVVVPADTKLRFSLEERKWIEDKGREIGFRVSTDSSEEEFKYTLKNGKSDLIHFCTHGRLEADPLYSIIELESNGKIRPIDISGEATRFGNAHPLVFMNACESGAQQIFLTGIQSWVMRMIGAGVSAFVGTLWSVTDEVAIEFAKAFYSNLLNGYSLGESVKMSRQYCRKLPNAPDASWLAYVLYGEPNATITLGKSN